MGRLPFLDVDGQQIAQSKSIERFVAKKYARPTLYKSTYACVCVRARACECECKCECEYLRFLACRPLTMRHAGAGTDSLAQTR